MGHNILYRTLFEVKVLHHYYLNKGIVAFDKMNADTEKPEVLRKYDTREFLTIEPTETCKKILKQHRCIFKTTPSGFLVGLQCLKTDQNKFKPVFIPPGASHFSFLGWFTDSFFMNYTALPMKRKIKDLESFIDQSNNIYFCQNNSNQSSKKHPYLTGMAPAFKNGEKYSAGDILSDNANNATKLFIAKKITEQAPPDTDWITDELIGGKPLQYTCVNDLLPVFTNLIRFNSGKADANLAVTVTDVLNQSIPVKAEFIKDKINTTEEKLIALCDIHLLDEGLYKIKFEDAAIAFKKEFSFYRLQTTEPADMIIDLAVKSDNADYNMTDGNDVLKDQVYEIRFRNRFTQWQYKGKIFSDSSVTGPHPLTKNGYINASVKDKDNNDIDDLPNPSVKMVKTITEPDSPAYNTISEIFIH